MPPRPAPRRGGVALGVLGIMMMAFFSIVFMFGRPHHWHPSFHLSDLAHPFDPHPIGVVRHTSIPLVVEGGSIKQGQGQQATKVDATPSPSATQAVTPTPSPTPTPAPTPKATPTPTPKAAEALPPKTDDAKKAGNEDDVITDLDKHYKPTRDMVQRIAQQGYLVVTWANYHYFDFVKSWVMHVKDVGITGYIVGAMDDHLLRELIALKYNCFSMKSGLTLGDFGWGSKTFAKMGREKIRLISIFLKLDVYVVIADVDVMWLRNPIPYFERYPEADVLTSSDNMANTVPDESLERWPHAGAAANIGIMMFRNKSLPFVEKWIEIIEKDDTVWDQNAFNDLFRQGNKPLDDNKKNLFLGYNGQLMMGILPVSLFCSGHTMYVQRMGANLGLQPYAVHATFQFSGTPGKRHRMREFMLWADPPEYYDHKVGFISFDMDGVDALLPGAGPLTGKMDLANVQGHFKLVNHQLLRIRTAFAVGWVLKRAVVMPKLWCGLDRWWAPHAGRIPGANFELPFVCPLDHVLDLEGGIFRKDQPEAHIGPPTEIREYSFFDNPKTPKTVKDDKIIVEICPVAAAGCSAGDKPAEVSGGRVRVQAGLNSDQLATALSNVASHKVLHFTTMNNAFTAFTDKHLTRKFTERMRMYGSIWCCVHAHPGHIHYDLLFDQEHEDKFGRHWNATWVPMTGP